MKLGPLAKGWLAGRQRLMSAGMVSLIYLYQEILASMVDSATREISKTSELAILFNVLVEE